MRFKCNVSKQAIVLTRTEGLVFGGGETLLHENLRELTCQGLGAYSKLSEFDTQNIRDRRRTMGT